MVDDALAADRVAVGQHRQSSGTVPQRVLADGRRAVSRDAVAGWVSFVDGKPLLVGGASKDLEARVGRATMGFGKGYKVHVLWANRCFPEAWEVAPLNVSESIVAQALVAQAAGGGYLLADGNYDTNPLADQAGRYGYQLVAAPRRPNAGRGHRHQSPYRRRGLELKSRPFGRALFAERYRIEQWLGQATTFSGGLTAPPAWVRGQHRIRTWVWAKLLINAVRIHLKTIT